MEAFAGLGVGVIGAILILFWAVAGLLMPFLVWGIYNQSCNNRKELEKIRALLEQQKPAA